jgi:hypothetical protein
MITPKKAPYSTTVVEPEKTIGDINRLFKGYGITQYQWTTLWDSNIVTVKFAIEVEPGKFIPIRITPPAFLQKRRTWNAKLGRYETVEAPNWAQSLRLLYYVLKAKIEAIAYGLRDAQEEFMGDILVKLPNGQEGTMSEAMRTRLPYSNGTEPLELGTGV